MMRCYPLLSLLLSTFLSFILSPLAIAQEVTTTGLATSLEAAYSRLRQPLLDELKVLEDQKALMCLFDPEIDLAESVNELPRTRNITVFVEREQEVIERISGEFLLSNIRSEQDRTIIAADSITQQLVGTPLSTRVSLTATALPVEKRQCEIKDTNGKVTSSYPVYKPTGPAQTVDLLRGVDDSVFVPEINDPRGRFVGDRLLMNAAGRLDVDQASFRLRPQRRDIVCRDSYAIVEMESQEFTQFPLRVEAQSIDLNSLTVAYGSGDSELRGRVFDGMRIPVPLFNGEPLMGSFINFFAKLRSEKGEQEVPVYLPSLKNSGGAFNVNASQPTASSFSLRGISLQYLGGVLPTEIQAGVSLPQGSTIVNKIQLIPIPLEFSIDDLDAQASGVFVLERGESYQAAIATKDSTSLNLSKLTLDLDVKSADDSISIDNSTPTFSKHQKGWRAGFKITADKLNNNTSLSRMLKLSSSQIILRSERQQTIALAVVSAPIKTLDVAASFRRQPILKNENISLFYGHNFLIDNTRARGLDGITVYAKANDGKTRTSPTPIERTPGVLVKLGDDNLLTRRGSELKVSAKGTGETRIGLSLDYGKAVVESGQRGTLDSSNQISVQVNELRLLKSQRVSVFTPEELQQQRVDLAGDKFEPESISIDQLQRRQIAKAQTLIESQGPSAMGGYSVQWLDSSGKTHTSPFTQQGSQWQANAPEVDAATGFSEVRLIDPQGKPIGHFPSSSIRQQLQAPKITLSMSNKAETGQVQKVRAIIRQASSGRSYDYKGQVFCRWHIGKANEDDVINAGVFRQEDTPVVFASLDLGRCENELVLHRIDENIGKNPPVTVQLIYKGKN